jgi:AcrR family transcriptional regulator
MRKGLETRKIILEHALGVAAVLGLESLTIGSLASALSMSKSGLFAHFKSKQELQLQVLQEAVERFVVQVVAPAIRKPRGEPRVRAFFDRWLDWSRKQPGGCVIHSASSELDDRPGPLRDFLLAAHQDWRNTIRRGVRVAIEEGHFRSDLDADQFAFEFVGLALGYHHAARLLNDKKALKRARTGFDALLERARS